MLFLLSNKVFHTNSKEFQLSIQPQVLGEAFEIVYFILMKSISCIELSFKKKLFYGVERVEDFLNLTRDYPGRHSYKIKTNMETQS